MAESTINKTINKTAQEQSASVYKAAEEGYAAGVKQKDLDKRMLDASAYTVPGDDEKVGQYTQEEVNYTDIDTKGGILPGNEYRGIIKTDYTPDSDKNNPISVVGTQSIHNKYIVFKLQNVSGYENNNYDSTKHYDVLKKDVDLQKKASEVILLEHGIYTNKESNKKFIDERLKPTAKNICNFADKFKEYDDERQIVESFVTERLPYSISDFVYSKWYGKIPNTNLITLRRFAQAVTDDACNKWKQPQLPIAQALTYFGEGTGNKLSSILSFTYGLMYEKFSANVWEVEGNEAGFGNGLESVLGKSDMGAMAGLIAYARMAERTNDEDSAEKAEEKELDRNSAKGYFTGTTARESKWSRTQWNDGAYWNQIYGPVNVINENHKRVRGMDFQNDMNLKFSYCLRSIDGINPKVAMLDLIVNFLSLTYNNARFWGGMNRYFPKTDFQTEAVGDPDEIAMGYWGSVSDSLSELSKKNGTLTSVALSPFRFTAYLASLIGRDSVFDAGTPKDADVSIDNGTLTYNGDKLENDSGGNFMERILSWITSGSEDIGDKITSNLQAGLTMMSASIAKNRPEKLSIRSMLSGEPVGEWHLVVGNPMNPIVVMGNMIVEKCTINFNDTLGIDDFPTEVTFTVSLKHARPRDVADIESMFNLGCGKMSYSPLTSTSSEMNTFGEAWESGGGGNSMVSIKKNENGKAERDENGTVVVQENYVNENKKNNNTFASSTVDFKNFDEEYAATHQKYTNEVKVASQETYNNIQTKIENEWGSSFANANQLRFLLQKTKIKW